MEVMMRQGIVITMLLLVINAGLVAQTNDIDSALQANAAYDAGDYVNAISLYEALVTSGVDDNRVYFNLGNAYYQSRNWGRALLNYRRAQQITPRDSDIAFNIAQVQALRADVLGDELNPVNNLAGVSEGLLTVHELGWIVLGMWGLVCGGGVTYIARPDLRPQLRSVLSVFGLIFLCGLLLFAARLYVDTARPAAIITASTIQVMSGPGDGYISLYRLNSAAEIRIMEKRGEWVRFMLPDERQGWLPETAIERVQGHSRATPL